MLGDEAAWDDPLDEHEDFLREWLDRHDVQTNEVQRSWILLPPFLHIVGSSDVHVVELGASAGLNLVWDRYRYEYEHGDWGPPTAAVVLQGEERRQLPAALFEKRPRLRTRTGIDRAPIDVRNDEAVRYLKSFVWAGQHGRMERLEAAVAELRRRPPELVRGELPEALGEVLAGLPRDDLTLVFQTAVLGYLSQEGRDRIREILEAAGRDLVFVSAGSPRGPEGTWGMRIFRPGRGREFVGHADFHGAWLDYEL